MNYLFKTCLLIFAMLPIAASAQKTYELIDPSGKLKINLIVDKNDIQYNISHDGDTMVQNSDISMMLTDGRVFGKNPSVKKVKRNSVNATITPPVYKKATIEDLYNELIVDFKDNYSIILRAYPDGVAYRFVSNLKEPFFIASEQVHIALPEDTKVYAAYPRGRQNEGKADPFYSSFQNYYEHLAIKDWQDGKLAFLPLLVDGPAGKKICITEADLLSYPGMYLTGEGAGLRSVFPAYPKKVVDEVRGLKGVVKSREDYIAKAEGKTAFPWRVFVISEQDTDLLCSDLVYKLATPAPEADYSWIKPGKVAWDWWNDWNIYNVDFRAGINNETYKYYIDFASENNIEYVILDEGWAVPGEADLFKVVPEIDLKELVSYAAKKNIDLILWAGYRAFEKDMDAVCKHYASMGIKGFKIDFMDRDDQHLIEFNRKAAETGLKYNLLINLHGTSKPTGLQRTFPNCINFEGVFGLEELKWAEPGTDMVKYDVTLPFIRMVAGPLDYTQGAMNNVIMKNFNAVYTEPMSQGTRCRQIALYIVLDSPINMLCDAPSNYLKEAECTRFITSIPTVWEQTIPLQGNVGEHIVMARRSGDEWYVGGLTDWTARKVEIDLSFLGEGNYTAELFRDGINADRVAKDYKREIVSIPANKKMTVKMAPGGGFVMRIKQVM